MAPVVARSFSDGLDEAATVAGWRWSVAGGLSLKWSRAPDAFRRSADRPDKAQARRVRRVHVFVPSEEKWPFS